MKTSLLCLVLVLASAVGISSCASFHSSRVPVRHSPHSFALSVSVPTGTPLTPHQWALIRADFQRELAANGYTLVDDLVDAESIIYVEFIPSENDPDAGITNVVSVAANPVYALNRRIATTYTASYGPGGYLSSDPSRSYYNSYYGYNDPFYSSPDYPPVAVAPNPPSPAPPATTPPANHPPPSTPPDHRPGAPNHPPPHFGGDHSRLPPPVRGDHPRPPIHLRPDVPPPYARAVPGEPSSASYSTSASSSGSYSSSSSSFSAGSEIPSSSATYSSPATSPSYSAPVSTNDSLSSANAREN
jgi:hypothetical protein